MYSKNDYSRGVNVSGPYGQDRHWVIASLIDGEKLASVYRDDVEDALRSCGESPAQSAAWSKFQEAHKCPTCGTFDKSAIPFFGGCGDIKQR